MLLDADDIAQLVTLRRRLHSAPELSDDERRTAQTVRDFLVATRPDRIIPEIGGHGIAFAYEGAEPGPTLMFCAELDALPIEERATDRKQGAWC